MKSKAKDKMVDDRFELLKKLLLANEREELETLRNEVLEKERFKSKVDPVVDQKIEDLKQNFPVYFGDTITKTIKAQIKESQDEVVEALYPIMGKLVKKFIVSEIQKLTDSINETISNKLAPKQILKRFFSRKKADASEVLQEVFEPVIEEVFVISKDSGLLIGNFSRGNIADKDMVSGMLTAIKAFVEDAFAKEGQDLEDIKFETFQISLMSFKTIYIATATSGVLSRDFKEDLSDRLIKMSSIILRDRSYLEDEHKLNELIKGELIL